MLTLLEAVQKGYAPSIYALTKRIERGQMKGIKRFGRWFVTERDLKHFDERRQRKPKKVQEAAS